jgi:hypothetical protein
MSTQTHSQNEYPYLEQCRDTLEMLKSEFRQLAEEALTQKVQSLFEEKSKPELQEVVLRLWKDGWETTISCSLKETGSPSWLS